MALTLLWGVDVTRPFVLCLIALLWASPAGAKPKYRLLDDIELHADERTRALILLQEEVIHQQRMNKNPLLKRGKTLKEEVCITHVFVSDPESGWGEREQAEALKVSRTAMDYLTAEATKRGFELTWRESKGRYTTSVLIPISRYNSRWTSDVNIERDDLLVPHQQDPAHGCHKHVQVLYVAKIGESFAQPRSYMDHENIVIYRRKGRRGKKGLSPLSPVELVAIEARPTVFVHELLHIFGAEDLYKPEARKAEARRRYPDDIMLAPNRSLHFVKISPYTEYLIGWNPVLPPALPTK
ncbi:MAG: hypothetical protein GY811_30530 [Myxococcales bacterium]|nr:hypothetical protein [Myxococcales bacterium]